MLIILTTESGTQYTLDTDTKSWKRVRNPEACNPRWVSCELEINEGTYAQVSFEFGQRLRLVNAPDPDMYGSVYVVTSTPIIGVAVYEPQPVVPMSQRVA